MAIMLPKAEPISDKERFRIFKEECEYWLDLLSLRNWIVAYEFSDDYSEDWESDSLAMLRWNEQARRATIWLNENWPEDEISHFQICRSAFHEVFELFLSDLRSLAMNRYIAKGSVELETHRIVRTLENVFFPKDYARRKRLSKRV